MRVKRAYSENHKVVSDSPHTYNEGGACYDDGGGVGEFVDSAKEYVKHVFSAKRPESADTEEAPPAKVVPNKHQYYREPVRGGKGYDEMIEEQSQ